MKTWFCKCLLCILAGPSAHLYLCVCAYIYTVVTLRLGGFCHPHPTDPLWSQPLWGAASQSLSMEESNLHAERGSKPETANNVIYLLQSLLRITSNCAQETGFTAGRKGLSCQSWAVSSCSDPHPCLLTTFWLESTHPLPSSQNTPCLTYTDISCHPLHCLVLIPKSWQVSFRDLLSP